MFFFFSFPLTGFGAAVTILSFREIWYGGRRDYVSSDFGTTGVECMDFDWASLDLGMAGADKLYGSLLFTRFLDAFPHKAFWAL